MRFWSSQGLMYIDGQLTQMTVYEVSIGMNKRFCAIRPSEAIGTEFCRTNYATKTLTLTKIDWLQGLCKWVLKFQEFKGYEIKLADEIK